MRSTITFYNEQVDKFQKSLKCNSKTNFDDIRDNDSKKISWSSSLISHASGGIKAVFKKENIKTSHYRPFFKQHLYYDWVFNHRVGKMPNIFPPNNLENLVICVSGVGVTKEFSCLITDKIPDLEFVGKSQCFPLYYYEEIGIKREKNSNQSFLNVDDTQTCTKYSKQDGISDYIFQKAKNQYGNANLIKEDLFYYVYGILHSPDYRKTFSNDLKKMLPRIPLVDDIQDFWSFSIAGRKLADLHLKYEVVPPLPEVKVIGVEKNIFRVIKMKFPQKNQKDTILFNSNITISGIPEQAYKYVVNGKSAIEWVMERYQISLDADSGIINDPNDWAKEIGKPRYILDLLLSVINVSVQSVDIIEVLPKLNFE